jgi:hypothetical protein
MENGELLKAIEQMMARMDASQDKMETKIDASRRADQEHVKETVDREVRSLVSIMEAGRKTETK